MKLYATITGIALVVSLVVCFTLFNKGTTTVVHQDGTTTTVGAAASPDRFSPYESRNGIVQWFTRLGLGQATTTVCNIKTPSKQSVLVELDLGMTVSSTSAATVTIATSTQITATSTQLMSYTTIANGISYFSFIPTTTAMQVQSAGQWINVSMTGGTGTYSPTGFCQATFEQF